MENTLENKAKFFSQYWGQTVIADVNNAGEKVIYPVEQSNMYRFEESHLQLKCLSLITDLEASELADKFDITIGTHWLDEYSSLDDFKKSLFPPLFCHEVSYFDYIRSKGYALPYMDLSVEKLIEYGWVKLNV